VDDFYSYRIEHCEDDSFSYNFITKTNTIYAINFDLSEYVEHLQDFPALLQNGYSFSIFCFPPEVDNIEKRKYDKKISNTIFRIILNHFSNVGTESVLLFHCDSSDNLQRCRHILFNRWFNSCSMKIDYVMETLEVEIAKETPVMHYLGYITMKNNPDFAVLQEEFNSFSMHMIGSKITPLQ